MTTKNPRAEWLRGFLVRPKPRHTSQVSILYSTRRAESNAMERACPKWDSNPHAVSGTQLRGVRVCQFRHSGTSAKNVRNRVRPQQITSRSLIGTIVLIGGASVTNRLPTGAGSCRYRKSVNCVMGAAPAEPSYDPLSNTPIWCTDEEKREGAVRHQELG